LGRPVFEEDVAATPSVIPTIVVDPGDLDTVDVFLSARSRRPAHLRLRAGRRRPLKFWICRPASTEVFAPAPSSIPLDGGSVGRLEPS